MKAGIPRTCRRKASKESRAGNNSDSALYAGSGGATQQLVCRLVDAYADLILRLAYARFGHVHDAQDICQTVLLKLLQEVRDGKARFKDAEHEKAWIVRVTINACIDLQKAAWNSKVSPLDEPDDTTETAALDRLAGASPLADTSWHIERDEELHEALAELAPIYREAIYLHYYEGYSAKEIARITGRTTAAIEQHLSRGRTKLRSLLEARGDER